MRQSLKVAISLLVTLLLFGGFVLLAFSGLFGLIESRFLAPGVMRTLEQEVSDVAGAVEEHQRARVQQLGTLLDSDAMANAYLSDQVLTGADIAARSETFGKLRQRNSELSGVRFLDTTGRNIHFSTFDTDERADGRKEMPDPSSPGKTVVAVAYNRYEQLAETISASDLIVAAGSTPRVLYDGVGQRLIYSFAMSDSRGSHLGTAVYYLGINDLRNALFSRPGLVVRDVFVVDRRGIIVNFEVSSEERAVLQTSVAGIWDGLEAGRPVVQPFDYRDSQGTKFLLASYKAEGYGVVGILKSQSSLALDPLLMAFLLAVVFVTLFLGAFLILNIRQDPVLVMTSRVRRFQVEFVQEFLESGDELRSERWRAELARRKTALSAQIKRGVGRVTDEKQREIDDLINRSWEEILAILSVRSPRPRAPEDSMDLRKIEEIIQRALSGGKVVIQAQSVEGVEVPVRSRPVAALATATEEAVEEAPSEAVEEAVEEIGEADDVEDLGEEPVGEEPFARGTAPPVSEAETTEDLEEIGDAEEAEEVRGAAAPARVGPAAPKAEAVEVPAEAADDIEEAEAVEELVEADEVDEAEGVSLPPRAVAPASVAADATPSEVGAELAEEVEELEDVEELVEDLPGEIDEAAQAEVAPAATAVAPPPTGPLADVPEGLGEFDLIEAPGDERDEEGVEEIGEIEAFGELDEVTATPEPPPAELGVAAASTEPLIPDAVEELEYLDEAALEEVGELAPEVETEEDVEVLTEAGVLEAGEEHVEPLPPVPEEEGLELLASPDEEPFGRLETEIEEGESLEEAVLEEIGELEPAEPAQPHADEEPAVGDDEVASVAEDTPAAVAQFRELVRSGSILVHDAASVAASLAERHSSVVLENGVYRIREDLYGEEPAEGEAGDLRELAESVMSRAAVGGEESGAGVSGIGDLLGGVESLDLLDEAEIEDAPAETRVDRGRKRAKVLHFREAALDMDEYLRQYPDPEFEPTRFRALVEVSRRAQAVAAVMLVSTGGAWRPTYSVGFSEAAHDTFHLPLRGVVSQQVLSSRSLALVNVPIDEVQCLALRAAPEDLRFMRRAVFVPAWFRGSRAYLFLSFAEERNWRLGDLLEALDAS